jgi:hypothetical protein
MKRLLIAAVLAAVPLGACLAQSPPAKPVCLNATDIKNTGVIDNRTVMFFMNNGTAWKNTLEADCPGLKMADGFDYTINGGTVCAREQPIRVHDGPSRCFLGDFTQVTTGK